MTCTVPEVRIRVAVSLVMMALLGATAVAMEGLNRALEERFASTAQPGTTPNYAESAGRTGDREGVEGDWAPLLQATDQASWEREGFYLMHANWLRQGWGPVLKPQVERVASQAKVKVLALGDSFVWGQGVEDLDMRWPQVLERKLNLGGGGSFEVTSLGRLPASFMQYVDWLDPQRLAALKPDVIVIGYLGNDFFPTYEERALCEPYASCTKDGDSPVAWNPKNGPLVECLKGQGSALGFVIKRLVNPIWPYVGKWLTNRYCDPDRINANDRKLSEGFWMKHPETSPFWGDLKESITKLGENTKGIPVLIYDYDHSLEPSPTTGRDQSAIRDLLTGAGLEVVTPVAVDKAYEEAGDEKKLWINPTDNHPNASLTHAYAEDIKNAVYAKLGLDAIGQAFRPATELISNYLPATLAVAKSGEKWVLEGGPLSEQYKDRYNPKEVVGNIQEGVEAPCARVGRPHARVMLNPYLLPGTQVTYRLSEAEKPMIAQAVSYDEEGRVINGPQKLLRPGDSYEVAVGNGSSGLLLATLDGSCTSESVRLPFFKLEVSAAVKAMGWPD